MAKIILRSLGRKKPLGPDWDVPTPPEWDRDGGEPVTLRDVITRIVHEEVEAFRKRQKARRLVRFLSKGEIEEGARRGKIDMGGRDLEQEVDDEEAAGTALTAFEDGLFLVLIDGEEIRDLDQQVYLNEYSVITFIRLTMLAGG